ncbi:hypothetical protein IGI04_036742 [Brassica rapa subsp. trilocularis]|uniref:Uncharacterized protein n=1 Tax=Brassica rapa subsp. trilocularis TaxID=1813537 RepID=A0ABQ7LGA8_BRACM|nr:hypothetical protein IGI04_036742 [Brassica rapa subsp. trilocularis]
MGLWAKRKITQDGFILELSLKFLFLLPFSSPSTDSKEIGDTNVKRTEGCQVHVGVEKGH